jgi:tetratricopeptide (TPR) repeat protein
MDIENIDGGQFDTIILNQIAARPYFLVVLTPGTLDRCVNEDDWLKREMEHALSLNRIIIPLTTPEFKFEDVQEFLTGKLATELPRFNAVSVPHDYFEAAMERLRTRFLKPIDLKVTPTPEVEQAEVARRIEQVKDEPKVTEEQLLAEQYFERGKARAMYDFDGQIYDYGEAIRFNPDFIKAYNNRGTAHHKNGDLDAAINDYSRAIGYNPKYTLAYFNRGLAYNIKGNFNDAIEDFTQAIYLNPGDSLA